MRTGFRLSSGLCAFSGRLICLAVPLMIIGLAGARGAYKNPVLKVLLFYSSSGVYLTSSSSMTLSSGADIIGNGEKILITMDGPNSLLINNRIRENRNLVIQPSAPIKVLDLERNIKRTYLGAFEVALLNNRIHLVNHISTEAYLEGVLNAEISTRWHMEVVKAQAVISRTFALFKRARNINRPWHLSAGHFDQVYKGVEIADERGRAAIRATSGIVVGYRGSLAQTFYHSNCGGMTADPGKTWQHELPYLKIKSVPFGKSDPRYYWKTVFTDQEMKRILKRAGLPDSPVDAISISRRTPSNRVYEITVAGRQLRKLSGNAFRKASGYKRIQSLLFNLERVPGGYRFEGMGNGHGVGLSQWSAKEMAEEGYKYHEIIYYFYQDIKLMRYRG